MRDEVGETVKIGNDGRLFLHFHVGLKLAALAVALAVIAFIATRPERPRA